MDQFFDQSPVFIDDEDPEEQFELQDLIGEGAYGSVYKAQHKKSNQYAAVKIVPSSEEIQSLQKETQILKVNKQTPNIPQECKSPYIVKYYGSFFKNANLWLIMEYCAAGSVIDLLKITKKKLCEEEIAAILYYALKGIEYLHANKKIHRDIKAGNILLDHNGNAKLADFGVSAQLLYTNADKETFIGTPFWMSPEVISKHKYNNLTDIWSLGVTAIELAEGQPPLSHMHPVRAMFVIRNNPPKGLTEPSKWSTEFTSFVQSCLKVEVSERPTATQLLQSKFILLGQKEVGRLKKLVEDSLHEIEEYRKSKQSGLQNSQFQDSIKSKPINSNPQTMVRKDSSDSGSDRTAIEVDTLVVKNGNTSDVEEQKELDFVSYAKKLKIVEELETQEKKLNELKKESIIKHESEEEDGDDEQYEQDDEQDEEEEEEKQVEKQIEKMNAQELEKFLEYLLNKMEEDIQKVREKYSPKIEDLKKRIGQKKQQEHKKQQLDETKLEKGQEKQQKIQPLQQQEKQKEISQQQQKQLQTKNQVENQKKEQQKQEQFWAQLRQQQDQNYISQQQYKRPEKLESNLQQIINLPFNFQVNQELLNKLSNIKIPELKLQGVSPSSQLRSNPKKLPFEFIPQVKKQ